MLDAVGFFNDMMQNSPEEILEFSDWMGIPMGYYPVAPDRFLRMLSDEVKPTGEFK
jgi:hypothetical protein